VKGEGCKQNGRETVEGFPFWILGTFLGIFFPEADGRAFPKYKAKRQKAPTPNIKLLVLKISA